MNECEPLKKVKGIQSSPTTEWSDGLTLMQNWTNYTINFMNKLSLTLSNTIYVKMYKN